MPQVHLLPPLPKLSQVSLGIWPYTKDFVLYFGPWKEIIILILFVTLFLIFGRHRMIKRALKSIIEFYAKIAL